MITFNFKNKVYRIVNEKLFCGSVFVTECTSKEDAYIILSKAEPKKDKENLVMDILEVDKLPLTETRLRDIQSALINNNYYPSNFLLKEFKNKFLPNMSTYILADGTKIAMSVETNSKLNNKNEHNIPHNLKEFVDYVKTSIGK